MNESAEITVVDDRDITLLVIAFIALALTIGMLVVTVILLLRDSSALAAQGRLAEKTYRASCSYKEFLKAQVHNSKVYLVKHPQGAPALGISRVYIQRQISRQQAAVDALSDLTCSQ